MKIYANVIVTKEEQKPDEFTQETPTVFFASIEHLDEITPLFAGNNKEEAIDEADHWLREQIEEIQVTDWPELLSYPERPAHVIELTIPEGK